MKSRLILTTLVTTIAAAVLSACGSAMPATTGTPATIEASSSSASSLSPTTTTATATATATTLALSSSPNTDYTRMYVAQQLVYYAAEGIELQIVPYATTAPETLIANG
ncbi:MAG: ABC transporter substrate-binding protein, partial [Actinomycetes bacterium]